MSTAGDHTRTDIVVSVAEKGTGEEKPSPAAAVIVVPAYEAAPAARTTLATVLVARAGSGARLASAPPKLMSP